MYDKKYDIHFCKLIPRNSDDRTMQPIKTLDTEGKALGLGKLPYIPPSVQPLVPSTPLPSALTGVVSPAWDPMSQTPLPGPSTGNKTMQLSM